MVVVVKTEALLPSTNTHRVDTKMHCYLSLSADGRVTPLCVFLSLNVIGRPMKVRGCTTVPTAHGVTEAGRVTTAVCRPAVAWHVKHVAANKLPKGLMRRQSRAPLSKYSAC